MKTESYSSASVEPCSDNVKSLHTKSSFSKDSTLRIFDFPFGNSLSELNQYGRNHAGFRTAIIKNNQYFLVFENSQYAANAIASILETTDMSVQFSEIPEDSQTSHVPPSRKKPIDDMGKSDIVGKDTLLDHQFQEAIDKVLSPERMAQSSCSLKISQYPTNFNLALLRSLLLSYPGFARLVFQMDNIFLVFHSHDYAAEGLKKLQRELSQGVLSSSGLSSLLIDWSEFSFQPISSRSQDENDATRVLFIKLFDWLKPEMVANILADMKGFQLIQRNEGFFLALFSTVDLATAALEELRNTTSLIVNYSIKGEKAYDLSMSLEESASHHSLIKESNLPISGKDAHKSDSPKATTLNTCESEIRMDTLLKEISYIDAKVPNTPTISVTIPYETKSGTTAPTTTGIAPDTVTSSSTNFSPRRTIHITNLDRDKADLTALISTYKGFERIIFVRDFCFVIFDSINAAELALKRLEIEQPLMIATFSKKNYQHVPTEDIGMPCSVLYLSNMFWGHHELEKHVSSFPGFIRLQYLTEHSFLFCSDIESAAHALNTLNSTTNLYTRYSRRHSKQSSIISSASPPESSLSVGGGGGGGGREGMVSGNMTFMPMMGSIPSFSSRYQYNEYNIGGEGNVPHSSSSKSLSAYSNLLNPSNTPGTNSPRLSQSNIFPIGFHVSQLPSMIMTPAAPLTVIFRNIPNTMTVPTVATLVTQHSGTHQFIIYPEWNNPTQWTWTAHIRFQDLSFARLAMDSWSLKKSLGRVEQGRPTVWSEWIGPDLTTLATGTPINHLPDPLNTNSSALSNGGYMEGKLDPWPTLSSSSASSSFLPNAASIHPSQSPHHSLSYPHSFYTFPGIHPYPIHDMTHHHSFASRELIRIQQLMSDLCQLPHCDSTQLESWKSYDEGGKFEKELVSMIIGLIEKCKAK